MSRLRTAAAPAKLPAPTGGGVEWNRVAGMLTGLAVGDSLGNTTEGRTPAVRRQEHGEIRDYLPNRYAEYRPVGLPSDDSQMAFWTVEHLLERGCLDPDRLGELFCSRQIFGMGGTVRAFRSEWNRMHDWLEATQESAGNGALMRIAPVVLPHLASPGPALWVDAVIGGSVTHNDYASNASCAGFVAVLWEAFHARPPVPPGFWLDRFIAVAQQIEGEERRYTPRVPAYADKQVALWQFADEVVRDALARQVPVVDACNSWYSGAFVLETVPSVLYILERCGNDPEEALVRAVNDTCDNDSAGAVVGAAVGALHGLEGLPRRWREGLLGRTTVDDDGRVFDLIDAAHRRFGSARS